MSTIHEIFAIGQNGMRAARALTAVASNNIANVNTAGYSRQLLSFEAAVIPGLGVRAVGPLSARDWNLATNIMAKRADVGFQQGKTASLSFVEPVLNDLDGSGLGFAISDFQTSLQQLSVNPSSMAERMNVVAAAKQMALQFRETSSQMTDGAQSALQTVGALTHDVNEIAREIAKLNQTIGSSQKSTPPAHGVVDRRDELLAQLSDLVDIQPVQHENGAVTVLIGGGRALVSDTIANELVTNPPKPYAGQEVKFQIRTPQGDRLSLLADVGSAIGGAMSAYTDSLQPALAQLDELAFELTRQFNEIHHAGYGLDESTDVDFFLPLPSQEGAAAHIRVAEDIELDPGVIAAAFDFDTLPGDNANLLDLIHLLSDTPITATGDTLAGGWEKLSLKVFADFRSAELATESESIALDQLTALQDSIRGVSVDEELLSVDRASRAYDATARVIQVANEMLDTVMNMLR